MTGNKPEDPIRALTREVRELSSVYYQGLSDATTDHLLAQRLVQKICEQSADFFDDFETQRVNFGKAHGLGNSIRQLSKIGIHALENKSLETVAKIQEMIRSAWKLIGELKLPADLAWRFDSENGQEMAEFEFLVVLLPCYNGENSDQPLQLPSAEDLEVSPERWLAGVGD